MFNERELFFVCPYCLQEISFLVEELYGNQSYIEDCEVCCQPIQITYTAEDGEILDFQTERADD
jgi:hypothetical protein